MDGMRKTAFWCAMVTVAAGLGCASSQPAGAPSAGGGTAAAGGPKLYDCRDGRSIGLQKVEGSDRLRLVFPEGSYTVLAPISDKGKTRYVDGIVTLSFDGDAATVTYASGNKPPLLDCKPR